MYVGINNNNDLYTSLRANYVQTPRSVGENGGGGERKTRVNGIVSGGKHTRTRLVPRASFADDHDTIIDLGSCG